MPGRRATRQKTCSTPSPASAGRTWSCSPTETPPQTIASVAVERPPSASRVAVAVVADDPRPRELGARALDQRRDRVRVRVADRARAQRLAGLLQLVAGGQHRDPRPDRAARPRRGPTEASTPSSAGPISAPGGDHRLPGRDVLAGAADVACPASTATRTSTASAPAVGVLDPDDGVGALGTIAAGRDRDRLARPERPRRRDGRRATRRPPSSSGRAAVGVGGPQRVAVHRRVVEPGHRVGAGHVLGQHPAERRGDRDRLGSPAASRAPAPARRAASISIGSAVIGRA